MTSYQRSPSKSRKTIVKPMLRKLTSSEQHSLDLDRPAAEQDALGIFEGGRGGVGVGVGVVVGGREGKEKGVAAERSSYDVQMRRANYQHHHRSTSVTSQFSTTTTASGHRAGSFVHPFQQTPRPYTPPLHAAASSYQHSLREGDLDFEQSAVLAEDDDQICSSSQTNIHPNPYAPTHTYRSPSNLSVQTFATSIDRSSSSPNVAQQQQHPLRITTSKQGSSSRLALVSSHTSLHLHSALSSDINSPADMMSPASALRSSLDGFRIRSRSDASHPPVRAEAIQEARRKFLEKELAKDEKAAREEVRQLEKRNQKEAQKIDRGHRRSSASDRTRSKRSKSDLTIHEKPEGLVGREYSSVVKQQTPTLMPGDTFSQKRRSGAAKLKTHSAWTKFVMWIRTRFIRMGKS